MYNYACRKEISCSYVYIRLYVHVHTQLWRFMLLRLRTSAMHSNFARVLSGKLYMIWASICSDQKLETLFETL